MSVENVQGFRKKVDGNEQLQRQISENVKAGNVDEVVTIGKKNGFEFSLADLKTVFGGFFASELSQTQLEAVVGGAPIAPMFSGFEQTLLLSASPQLQSKC
jgi:predicted ribosomally synthesized peptide with nif11-like leader